MGLQKVLQPDGQLKTITTVQDVFAWFPKTEGQDAFVRLYITAGEAGNVAGNDLLYAGVGLSLLVEYLEKNGVGLSIEVLSGFREENQVILWSTTVKAFEGSLDLDQVLLQTADPRFLRFADFRNSIALSNYWNKECPPSMGAPLRPDFVARFLPALIPESENALILGGVKSLPELEGELSRIQKHVFREPKP
jgi:hypothetical protein